MKTIKTFDLIMVFAFATINLSAQSFWSTYGNSGTNPGTNYIGTSDNVGLNININGTSWINISADGTTSFNGKVKMNVDTFKVKGLMLGDSLKVSGPILFSGSAIFVKNNKVKMKVDTLRVHGLIHADSMRVSGPLWIGDNSYYTVYANIFDYNWDSIAGNGDPGTSYEAYYNLQLNNCVSSAFDMHPLGQGGAKLIIHHNSFWTWFRAIGIAKPYPPDYSEIYDNFFALKPKFNLSPPYDPTEDPYGNNVDINSDSPGYYPQWPAIVPINPSESIHIYNYQYRDTIYL